jgi:hypothetical protein
MGQTVCVLAVSSFKGVAIWKRDAELAWDECVTELGMARVKAASRLDDEIFRRRIERGQPTQTQHNLTGEKKSVKGRRSAIRRNRFLL